MISVDLKLTKIHSCFSNKLACEWYLCTELIDNGTFICARLADKPFQLIKAYHVANILIRILDFIDKIS